MQRIEYIISYRRAAYQPYAMTDPPGRSTHESPLMLGCIVLPRPRQIVERK